MMVFLPLDTWIRLLVWMIIGFDVYLLYSMKNSELNAGTFNRKSFNTVAYTGIATVILLGIVAFVHHASEGENDKILFYFSLAFSAIHLIVYAARLRSSKNR